MERLICPEKEINIETANALADAAIKETTTPPTP